MSVKCINILIFSGVYENNFHYGPFIPFSHWSKVKMFGALGLFDIFTSSKLAKIVMHEHLFEVS